MEYSYKYQRNTQINTEKTDCDRGASFLMMGGTCMFACTLSPEVNVQYYRASASKHELVVPSWTEVGWAAAKLFPPICPNI